MNQKEYSLKDITEQIISGYYGVKGCGGNEQNI